VLKLAHRAGAPWTLLVAFALACSSAPSKDGDGTGGVSSAGGFPASTGGTGAASQSGGVSSGSGGTGNAATANGDAGMGGNGASATGSGGVPATATGGASTTTGGAGFAAGGGGASGAGNGGASAAGNGGAAGAVSPGARCGSGAICDDFETPAEGAPPDASKWNVLTSYNGQPSAVNSVIVDGMQHHAGTKSLHVHTATGDPVYIETKTLPAGSHFFVRAFAYFDVDPGARSGGHWGAIVGVGKKAGIREDVEVRVGGQFDILVANYSPNDALQTSASRDGFYDDGTKLPVRTWTCFEVEFDGTKDELRVYMNDAELDRMHVTDWGQFGRTPIANWSPAYDRLRIGYQSWNADTPVDVWYDSVQIDTQRVGCGT
jgi:hypothetical protein